MFKRKRNVSTNVIETGSDMAVPSQHCQFNAFFLTVGRDLYRKHVTLHLLSIRIIYM